MEVKTDSERVRLSRKMVLEFLGSTVDLSLTGPIVPGRLGRGVRGAVRRGRRRATGRLPRRRAAGERDAHEAGHHHAPPGDATAATVAQPTKVDNNLYVRDYSKCILCYKCVDACGEEAQNTFAIAVAGRGFDARISTEQAVPLPESACVYCGNCIGVCPTGALMFKSEYDMREAGHLGRVRPDRDRDDLPVLRRRLRGRAPRPGRPDRQGHLADRLVGHRRPPLHQGPLRLRVRQQPPSHIADRCVVELELGAGAGLEDAAARAGSGRPAAATEVVRRLCGVQAQVASSAELAVRVRSKAVGAGDVGRALADGDLIKTWAMRGTLHLLTPEDAGAFLSLLAAGRPWERPAWQRYFEMDPAAMETLRGAVHEALDGRTLTREELIAAVTGRRGLEHIGDGLRSGWGTLLKPVAWQGDLCFGPQSGTRVTFMRPDQASRRWAGIPDPDIAGPIAIAAYLGRLRSGDGRGLPQLAVARPRPGQETSRHGSPNWATGLPGSMSAANRPSSWPRISTTWSRPGHRGRCASSAASTNGCSAPGRTTRT